MFLCFFSKKGTTLSPKSLLPLKVGFWGAGGKTLAFLSVADERNIEILKYFSIPLRQACICLFSLFGPTFNYSLHSFFCYYFPVSSVVFTSSCFSALKYH